MIAISTDEMQISKNNSNIRAWRDPFRVSREVNSKACHAFPIKAICETLQMVLVVVNGYYSGTGQHFFLL